MKVTIADVFGLWAVMLLVAKSCPTLCTLKTVAHQDPLSMEFSRQEYWSGLPFPSPGDLPDPGIKSTSPAQKADEGAAQERHVPRIE